MLGQGRPVVISGWKHFSKVDQTLPNKDVHLSLGSSIEVKWVLLPAWAEHRGCGGVKGGMKVRREGLPRTKGASDLGRAVIAEKQEAKALGTLLLGRISGPEVGEQ